MIRALIAATASWAARKDTLNGGNGRDNFYFDTAPSSSTNVDLIEGFLAVNDTIMLDRAIFRGIVVDGTLNAAAFHKGAAAADSADRIVYDSTSGNIFYDADGSGATAKILFAQVSPGVNLSALDFVAYTGG